MASKSTSFMHSLWRRWLHTLHQRGRIPTTTHVLGHRNLYVLPSAAGCMLAFTLLVLLIASINFQLNLGFLLTFLVAGSAAASLWLGHRNARGLQLQLGLLPATFQNTPTSIDVQLHSPRRQRHALSLALRQTNAPPAWAHTDAADNAHRTVRLSATFSARGWQPVPVVLLETRYPLGVFRIWSTWQPMALQLVYPAPEVAPPPLPWAPAAMHQRAPASAFAGALADDGIRPYQRGDAMRNVVWKKAANAIASGTGELVVRSTPALGQENLWLEPSTTGLPNNVEAQIARLTAWVLQAHAQHLSWGLALPSGRQLTTASGDTHLHACLSALAVDGLAAAPPPPAKFSP